MTNIVFTNNEEVGWNKLLAIQKEMNDMGVETIRKVKSKRSFMDFKNGIRWQVIDPCESARGYKYFQCYVDVKNTTLLQWQRVILPTYCGSWEDKRLNIRYFNYD